LTAETESPNRVLIVDDEPQIRRTLELNLAARGFAVELAPTGEVALELATRHHPDLVIVDLGLPKMSGIDVIRSIRTWSRVPILVLSARDARVRAALRRSAVPEAEATVNTPDFTVDLRAKRVTNATGETRLTPTQWHLVEVLVRNQGRLVTQRQLLQEVWGPGYGDESHYLRVFMAQIRRKLEPDPSHPRYFVTEPGIGYRFEA
jgi:two-component system KDP operon response regulator KdpE